MRRSGSLAPAVPVLVRQEDADRLLEALWRARVAMNISRRRSQWFTRNYARVDP